MRVTKEDLQNVPVPAATETWQPISHITVDSYLQQKLTEDGFNVFAKYYAMSRDGRDAVGTIVLDNKFGTMDTYHKMMVCWRNSMAKRASLAFTTGSQVLFCTNQMFQGNWITMHKHTKHIYGRLGWMFSKIENRLEMDAVTIEDFYQRLLDAPLTTPIRDHVLVQLCLNGALTWTQAPYVLNAMDQSDNVKHRGTLSQLYNAYTYFVGFKDSRYLSERTPIANRVFNEAANSDELYALEPSTAETA